MYIQLNSNKDPTDKKDLKKEIKASVRDALNKNPNFKEFLEKIKRLVNIPKIW